MPTENEERLIEQLENILRWYIELRKTVFRDGSDSAEITEAREVMAAVRANDKVA